MLMPCMQLVIQSHVTAPVSAARQELLMLHLLRKHIVIGLLYHETLWSLSIAAAALYHMLLFRLTSCYLCSEATVWNGTACTESFGTMRAGLL